MKLTTLALVLLSAACVATSATAEDGIPGDRLVPADARPPLDGFAGKPWFHMLRYCAALYIARGDYLRDEKSDPKAGEVRMKGVPYMAAMTHRLQKDRGLENDAAFKLAINQVKVGQLLVAARMDNQLDDKFAKAEALCAVGMKAVDALPD